MKREAFTMKLKPGKVMEYRRRHDEIWPELVKKHSEYGIRNYTIFLDEESLTLFAFQELAENATAERMRDDELVRKWWIYNADLMECHPDCEPVSRILTEIFHMN